jgi:peptide/nickel transport system substrate-binding protein
MAKVLRVGTLTPISTLDPRVAHDFTGHLVISQVFETPYRRLVDDRFEPVLMAGPMVRQERAGRVWFEAAVRSGVRFSDGSPVTAEDIARSVQLAVEHQGLQVVAADDRLSVSVPEGKTPRIELILSDRIGSVVKDVGNTMLGTGPFAVAAMDREHVHLVRNPHSSRKARIDEIDVRCLLPSDGGQPSALVRALVAGEVDFTISLSRDDVDDLKHVRKLFQPGMSTAILSLNTETPHFGRRDVRWCMVRAIDRYNLTQLCYSNPAAFVARALLPPGLGRGNDGIRHDPTRAKAELPAGVLPKRLRMVRVWGPRPYLSRPDAVAAAITDQLRELGTEVEVLAATDSEHYFQMLRSGDYDMCLGGWVADTTDPIDYLRSTLGTTMIPTWDRSPSTCCNYARFSDPMVDALLADAHRGARETMIAQILNRVADEVPLLPLMYGPRVIVHAWRVRGFSPDDGVLPDFSAIELDD